MPPESAREKHQRQRLHERFPGVHHPSLVDKDFTAVTSDRRAHLPQRTFFLGEIFWAETTALPIPRSPAAPEVLPALVTRRTRHRSDPVLMAPSVKHRPDQHPAPPGLWLPGPTENLTPGTAFLLRYRRSVPRHQITGHPATLTAQDKQRLSTTLATLDRTANSAP